MAGPAPDRGISGTRRVGQCPTGPRSATADVELRASTTTELEHRTTTANRADSARHGIYSAARRGDRSRITLNVWGPPRPRRGQPFGLSSA
jgi:hypothetical protein